MRAGASWERLAGSGSAARGSLLLAMLVTMTIGSIVLAIASTEWSFIIRREKEKELIFRGVQIARAIDSWQGPGKPPPTNLEMMTKPPRPVLRREYSDPMTARHDDDGELVEGTGEWGYIGMGGPTPPRGGTSGPGRPTSDQRQSTAATGLGSRATPSIGPILGVHSTSEDLSITSYREHPPETPLSQWEFRGLGFTSTMTNQLGGGYEIPRPPGFGGVRLPGGPPPSTLPGAPGTGGQQPGRQPGAPSGGQRPGSR